MFKPKIALTCFLIVYPVTEQTRLKQSQS